MKKFLCVLIAAFCLFSFAACGDGEVTKVRVPGPDVDAPQEEKGTLTGMITEDGVGIEGVTVSFGTRSTKNMRSGRYAMHSVEIADGELTVRKEGYFEYNIAVKASDFVEGTAKVDVDISRIATISGKVCDMDGAPLSGVTVRAGNADTVTDFGGGYELTYIPTKDNVLTFEKEGYGTVTRLVRKDWYDEDGIVEGLETFMHRMAKLHGKVRTAAGAGLAGATVSCGSETVRTDSEGKYELWVYPEIDYYRPVYEILYEMDGYASSTNRISFGNSLTNASYDRDMGETVLTSLVVDEKALVSNSRDEQRLNIYGRTIFNQSEKADEILNVMSGFEVKFCGTWLTVEMKTLAMPRINPNKAMFSTWSIFVDGATDPLEHELSSKSESWATYSLVSGLADGEHTVKVVKTDDPLISSCLVRNYKTDGEFLPKPARPKLKIEAFGDSITSGGDNKLYNNKPSEDVVPENSNGAATYVSYASYDLGAELNVFSRVGICLYPASSADTVDVVSKIYRQMSPLNRNQWDMQKYIPDVVVIGLGTNDQLGNQFTHEGFVAAYAQFVRELAAEYGNDTIFVLVHGFMDYRPTLEPGVVATVDTLKNEGYNVHRLKFAAARNGHPLTDEHRTAADALTALLRPLVEAL